MKILPRKMTYPEWYDNFIKSLPEEMLCETWDYRNLIDLCYDAEWTIKRASDHLKDVVNARKNKLAQVENRPTS